MADKTMSIEQAEQLLIKLEGRPDGKVAGELEDLQLTERVSPARLARWETSFPGKRTQEELMKLADMTSFMNPPASDVLRDPPPDVATEERMLAMAFDYVRLTTARLPDFYATRETTHFEDTLTHRAEYTYQGSTAMQGHGGMALPTPTPGMDSITEYRGLHSTGEFSMSVTYRDGHEVIDEATDKRKKEEESTLGLTSSGEFGPILGALIEDVVRTGVSFQRWEQGNGEPAAVFRFVVPANQSHFRIETSINGREEGFFPAYHGEIEIDPATGEILRLSEVADSAPQNEAMRAAIVVEYAPVKIGDQSYVCPVRGVAFSMISVQSGSPAEAASKPVQINLNDVAFTHYHQFGSEARIVANAGGAGGVAPGGSGAPETGTSESPATASVPAGTTTAASTGSAAETAPGATPPATEEAATTPAANSASTPADEAAKPAEPAAPAESAETTPAASSSAPAAGTPADASAAPSFPTGAAPGVPTLKVSSRLVIVDVVARNWGSSGSRT